MTTRFYTLDIQIELSHEEVQLVSLCIICATEKEIAAFFGIEEWEVKSMKASIGNRMGARVPRSLRYVMQLHGFDIYGCLKGEPLFYRRELRLLKEIAPWAKIEKTID